jgi:long-subunit acyl-CoA synthetase (AMP-forming)
MEPNEVAVDASVGELNPNIEAMIVSEEGKEVGVNERGEFWVKGPNVMKGYWRKPDATKDTLTEDGWLKTGDIAYRNERGFIYIVDRKKVRRAATHIRRFANTDICQYRNLSRSRETKLLPQS